MTYTLHGSPLSPFVRKVRAVLAEKGIEYTLNPVLPFAPPPDWRSISPLGRIPVLQIGPATERRFLPDSSVIAAWLEHVHPQPALLPTDPWLRARALWFEEFADTDLALAIGPGVFRPIVVARLTGQEPDHDLARATVERQLPPLLDYLEGELQGEWLVGDAPSLADLAVATSFVNLAHAGFGIDAARWPRLARHVATVLARPSMAGSIDQERAMLVR